MQVNEIRFFLDSGNETPMQLAGSVNFGEISFGAGETVGENTIFRHATTSPITGLNEIGFATLHAEDTGFVSEACINNVELEQDEADLSMSDIFKVEYNTGRVSIASDIRGGPHGTLDYETNPSFGFIVTVTDASGLDAHVSIRVQLLDVNEPPMFVKLCPKR